MFIRIWTPNIYISNEVESEVMSTVKDSVFVSISSMGEVNYHYRSVDSGEITGLYFSLTRMRSTVLCDIRLKRFPHDYQVISPGDLFSYNTFQDCELMIESWSLKTHQMILTWEGKNEGNLRFET